MNSSSKGEPVVAWLVFLAIIAWMILFNIRPIQDLDFWWHLTSGRYMFDHQIIPRVDVFSLTAKGTGWINTYWLQEFFTYGAYRLGGWDGIVLIKAILVAGIVVALGFLNPAVHVPWGTRLLGMITIYLGSHPRGFGWGEKASLVTYIFLGLLFWTLQSPRWPKQPPLFRMWPFLFILWANMHRGYILGLTFLSFYALDLWLKRDRERTRIAMWVAICAAATLMNPWGWGYLFMGWRDFRSSPTLSMGWAHTPVLHLELFWILFAGFWICLGWQIWNKKSVSLAFVATSAFLTWMSVRYASFYPYFVLWSVPWLLATWHSYRSSDKTITPMILGLLMAVIWSFGWKSGRGINQNVFPVKAVQFMKDNGLRAPFFHEFKWGGFFAWHFEGKPPVLIDGRIPAVDGYRALYPRLAQANQNPPEEFHRLLTSLGLEAAMVEYPSTEYLPSPYAIYFPRTEWALVYWDDLAVIFLRRKSANARAIKQFEFKSVQPDANPDFWLKRFWPQASPSVKAQWRADCAENVRQHPESERARTWYERVRLP